MRSIRVLFVVTVLLVAVPAAVGSSGPGKRECRAGVLRPVGTRTAAYAGVAKHAVVVYRKAGRDRLARLPRLNENGYPTTFAIVGAIVNRSCGASWYRVRVPMRPNGTIGYVRPAALAVDKIVTRIVVDLSARELTLFRKGKPVLRTPVAVGSSATPTPTGRYYVNQRILPTNAAGPYGPAALGISAFSNVLTGWAQGGPIGIHGTNEPWSIGHAVSNGCIRVPNKTIVRLFRAAVGGTPVLIRA